MYTINLIFSMVNVLDEVQKMNSFNYCCEPRKGPYMVQIWILDWTGWKGTGQNPSPVLT